MSSSQDDSGGGGDWEPVFPVRVEEKSQEDGESRCVDAEDVEARI